MKHVYSDKKASAHWSAARKKRNPAHKPLVVFLDSVYIRFRLFVLPAKCYRRLSSVLWKAKWSDVSWAHQATAVPPRTTPPSHAPPPGRAPPRPAPPVLCPGFGFDIYLYIYIYMLFYLGPTRTPRINLRYFTEGR